MHVDLVLGPLHEDHTDDIRLLNSGAEGSATVTGRAADNDGIAEVEVGTDNATWTTATGAPTWSSTLALVEGANTAYVRVMDTARNTAMSVTQVTLATSGGNR